MKQFQEEKIFTAYLLAGLRSSNKELLNEPSLSICKNTRVTDKGLEVPESMLLPLSTVTIDFPYPQLFDGRGISLLVYQNSLYSMEKPNSLNPYNLWTATGLTPYDCFTGEESSIVGSGIWHFMDMGNTWALFNGETTIFSSRAYEYFEEGPNYNTLVNSVMTIGTGCYFNGRSILSGFNDADSNTTGLADMINSMLPSGVGVEFGLRKNTVVWSSIGGGAGDLNWILYPARAIGGNVDDGYHGTASPLWIEQAMRNDWGIATLPFQGSVLKAEPSDNSVIIYGEDGIAGMKSRYQPSAGIATMSVEKVAPFGIAGRGCACAGNGMQIFIDRFGTLWAINDPAGGDPFKVEELGYSDYFDQNTDKYIIVYDEHTKDFYISNGEQSYILSKYGKLSESSRNVTSVTSVGNRLIGIYEFSADNKLRIVTDIFDLGSEGEKFIDSIGLFGKIAGNVNIRVDYRYEQDEPFETTEEFPLNSYGIAQPDIAGLQFRLRIEGIPYDMIELNKMIVRWKHTDKRFIRGRFSPYDSTFN